MPRVTNDVPVQQKNPDYDLTVKLLNEFQKTWVAKNAEAGIDPVRFSRLSVIALTQIASIVAVDVGMTVEQFENVCRANFNAAFEHAPKFGE